VVVIFEGSGGSRENIAFDGAWAWFRLLDQARLQSQSADTTFVYRLQQGSRWANLRVIADTIYNPFGKPLLRNFRCG
jgi:type VI secretion system protein ImpL